MPNILIGRVEWEGITGEQYESEVLEIEQGERIDENFIKSIIEENSTIPSSALAYERVQLWLGQVAATAHFIALGIFRE